MSFTVKCISSNSTHRSRRGLVLAMFTSNRDTVGHSNEESIDKGSIQKFVPRIVLGVGHHDSGVSQDLVLPCDFIAGSLKRSVPVRARSRRRHEYHGDKSVLYACPIRSKSSSIRSRIVAKSVAILYSILQSLPMNLHIWSLVTSSQIITRVSSSSGPHSYLVRHSSSDISC